MNIKATHPDAANWYPLTPVAATLVPPILPDTVHFDWSPSSAASNQSLPVPTKSADPATTGTIVDYNA
jgi:hypothetical protein